MKVLSVLFIFFSTQIVYGQNLLVRSVNLIDGRNNIVQQDIDIEIIDGKINRLGTNLKSNVKNVLQGNGLFAMPGLIDCHTHLKSVPGSFFRKDTIEQKKKQVAMQLKAYIAAGVTTVLDAAAEKSLVSNLKKNYGEENIPRIKVLSPFLTPHGGYFADEKSRGSSYQNLWEPVDSVAGVERHFKSVAIGQSSGVKVTFEEGFGPFRVWPLFEPQVVSKIVEEAKKKKLPIFVHSMSENEYRAAMEIKPYAFVHAGFNDKPASDKMVSEIKNSGAYVISTLAILKMTLLMWDHEKLDQPWLRRLVPEVQILTAKDRGIRKKVIQEVVLGSKPKWIPEWIVRPISGWFFNKSIVQHGIESSLKTVRDMNKQGVPLVMGSDAGNWPVWTTFFHGVGSILEMEALQEAGLSQEEIIRAATSRAAEMLKIDHQVGSIERGKIADILLLGQNPLDDMKSLRKIKWVIKTGNAKSPSDWLK